MIIVFNALEKGVPAVTIENLEIYTRISTEHKVSIYTKLIDTEDNYSLHVEENRVPTGKGSNGVLSNIASFDNFPAIKIGAGEKMRIRVTCDTPCIMFRIEDDPIVVKNNHISVQSVKYDSNRDYLWWGAIFYKPCKDHKGKFKWNEEKEKKCKWVSRKNKCSKGVAKQFCPETCGVC